MTVGSTPTYKGQTARIDFDDADGIFMGRLVGISDVVGFHADNVRELRAAFDADAESAQATGWRRPGSSRSDRQPLMLQKHLF